MLVSLKGSRAEMGYAYAALLHSETVETYERFISTVATGESRALLELFLDWTWVFAMGPATPTQFLEELAGIQQWENDNLKNSSVSMATRVSSLSRSRSVPSSPIPVTPSLVHTRFLVLASLPADTVNLQSAIENTIEPSSWPMWLRVSLDMLLRLVEGALAHHCDAFGVWGPRTQQGHLHSSRNLDWNSNTGIDQHKLVIVYTPTSLKPYASIGFAVGLGALAGLSSTGISVSEMNLDCFRVSLSAPPFPTRLRLMMETPSALLSDALSEWFKWPTGNSFNFLIGSARDNRAVALETAWNETIVFTDNSVVEASSSVWCGETQCTHWTNQKGMVRIGNPIPNAVWRTNHAFSPVIQLTMEPVFNDTIFRYNLQHDLFTAIEKSGNLIDDFIAVSIVATLGTKGPDFFSCSPQHGGSNVMSIHYAPQQQGGHFHVAWEQGVGSSKPWTPAACNPYVNFDFNQIFQII